MTKHYWDVFFTPHKDADHYLQAHCDGNQFPASGWWDIDDQWDWIEVV